MSSREASSGKAPIASITISFWVMPEPSCARRGEASRAACVRRAGWPSCARMKLAVLNPGGRDAEQAFPDGAAAPDEHAHPPVNFHGYAACTSGHFCRKDDALPEGIAGVLLLLRQDLKSARQ